MKINQSSNRSFGILFFRVFFLIGAWQLFNNETLRYWSLVISILFLVLGIFDSKLLRPLNKYWVKLGEILGRIIAPIIMGVIYFTVLSPISLIVRIFGKDLLKIRFSKDNSYWIKRDKNIGSMKKQF